MAHVTEPGFLHTFTSTQGLRGLASAELPRLVQQVRNALESLHNAADAPNEEDSRLIELSIALHHAFDLDSDRLIWEMDRADDRSASRDARLRLDGPRFRVADKADEGFAAVASTPESRLLSAVGLAQAQTSLGRRGWVVVITDSVPVASRAAVERLRSLAHSGGRFLLVVCDLQSASAVGASEHFARQTRQRAWMDFAAASDLDSMGPLVGNDIGTILPIIENVKSERRAATLYLTIPNRSPADLDELHDLSAPGRSLRDHRVVTTYLQAAGDHLARRALDDERIVAVSMMSERGMLSAWQSMSERRFRAEGDAGHALAWCAGLATGGCRPFVFLSMETLKNDFSKIQSEICRPKSPVTLLIDSSARNQPASVGGPLHDFALLRLLAQTAVVSPRNGAELKQMLDWSLMHDGPTAIWLPDYELSISTAERGSTIELGRAELVCEGDDVLLLAWGPEVESAEAAAKILAQDGISVAVLDARFAEPLDCQFIVASARRASCTVIVDRPSAGGGFSGRVLEAFAEQGLSQPVSVVYPTAQSRHHDLHSRHDHCVRAIVESCRYLAEPLVEIEPVVATLPASDSAAPPRERWLNIYARVQQGGRDEHQHVLAQLVSPSVEAWMNTYLTTGRRNLYFWKWCVHGAELTTLPCVLPQWRTHVCETKVLSIMLCVLLDDVADQQGKGRLLEALLTIINHQEQPNLEGLTDEDKHCAEVTRQLSQIYQDRIRLYPRYAEYEELLHYDLMQYFNTMRYSHLLNHQLSLLNPTEHDLYMPHAMHMMSFSTLDLMCTPDFDAAELGKMREVVWHAQCMGRIGNLLSTWRREIGERDFNSGVFARAVAAGDLTVEDLAEGDRGRIEAAICGGNHEQHFLDRWQHHRRCLSDRIDSIESVNMAGTLEGQERFFQMHFASRGLI